MKYKRYILFLLFLVGKAGPGQAKPAINITFSKLLATYDFVYKLSDRNSNKYKEIFASSVYNRQQYKDYLTQLDTLHLYESYEFQGYPFAQKIPGITTAFIERNLINSTSIPEFKRKSFGIIPNSDLLQLSAVLAAFEPVYDSLIYYPNKARFDQKLNELKTYIQQSNPEVFFQNGLQFYHTSWDTAIVFDIAIIPTTESGGFSARAFLNNAVSEVPLSFEHNDVLFSVLMHEMYHIQYDGQSLAVKRNIESWFTKNPSPNSQYAYLLLNEALATALGNGYVYEQLNGKLDKDDWYNVKYINGMAKQTYRVVKEYISKAMPLDKAFVDQYIALYDEHFPDWTTELDHLLTYRYVITDDADNLHYFRSHFPYRSSYQSQTPISESGLERMRQTPITKVVIITSDNKNKLHLVKKTFPELKEWKYKAAKEFIYTATLGDKTKLIIINSPANQFEVLFEKTFKNKRTM